MESISDMPLQTDSPETSRRALVYVRLSSHRGVSDPSTSPQRQREICESYCHAHGWQVVETVEELNVSGSDKGLRLSRPGIQKALAMAERGEIDVIVVAKLDRLCRNVLDFQTLAEQLSTHGATLVSVAERLDLSTPAGSFVATIMAAFAAMEAATIAERTAAGVRKTVELGRWPGGMAPYGFKIIDNPNGAGKVLDIDPDEAKTIQLAAGLILGGSSLYGACQTLNERGIKPRRASQWTMTPLKRILTSSATAGIMLRGGTELRNEDGSPRKQWPEILPLDDILKLRATLATNAEKRPQRNHARMLSGILRCGNCGERMVVGRLHNGTVSYRCNTRSTGSAACERGVVIGAEAVEAYITAAAMSLVGDVHTSREITRTDDASVVIRQAEIRQQLSELSKELTSASDDAMDGIVARIRELRAAETRLDETPRRRIKQWTPLLSKAWEKADGDVAAQRGLLSNVFAAAYVLSAPVPFRRGEDIGKRVILMGANETVALMLEEDGFEAARNSDAMGDKDKDGRPISLVVDGRPIAVPDDGMEADVTDLNNVTIQPLADDFWRVDDREDELSLAVQDERSLMWGRITWPAAGVR